MAWTNVKIANLIKEIETRPVIWDLSHEDYKNRNKKHEALQVLAEKFECNTTEILRKWRIILAQYRREKQKIKLASTTSDVYKPKWFGFKYLQFLQDDEMLEQLKKMHEPDLARKFKRFIPMRQCHGNNNELRVSKTLTETQPKTQKIEDSVDIFSYGVAAKIRKIKNENLKLLVQRDIDNLLYDALLGVGMYANGNIEIPTSRMFSRFQTDVSITEVKASN